MQTWVTYRSFARVAKALDMPRLGKQRSDVLAILRTLRHEDDTYANEHVVEMWRGHEECLVYYGLVITHEWRIVRQMPDATWGTLAEYAADYGMLRTPDMVKEDRPVLAEYPRWMTEDWILRSHRSVLIGKMSHHYGEQFGACPENMPPLWPVWDDVPGGNYKLFVSAVDLERLLVAERELPRPLELNTETGEVVVTQ